MSGELILICRIHCASPVTFGSREDPETLQKQVVDPAVKGRTLLLTDSASLSKVHVVHLVHSATLTTTTVALCLNRHMLGIFMHAGPSREAQLPTVHVNS